MKWKTRKPKPKPCTSWAKDDFVYVCKFAWWPTPVQQGDTYWLESVSYGYRALEDTSIRPGYDQICYERDREPDGYETLTPIRTIVWTLEFIIPWEKKHDLYNEKHDPL